MGSLTADLDEKKIPTDADAEEARRLAKEAGYLSAPGVSGSATANGKLIVYIKSEGVVPELGEVFAGVRVVRIVVGEVVPHEE
jgi:hypothetical protein